ncbi:MAG: hypothetical protein ACRDZ3_00450 [Acidimicrobiia bacterium]
MSSFPALRLPFSALGLIAYGPAKTGPESAWNIVIGVVLILVFAGVFLGLRARGRRAERRQPPLS